MSHRIFAVACILFSVFLKIQPAKADDWRPIEPAELSQKAPLIQKDADVEGIFWDVRLEGEGADLQEHNYIRIKIFTEKGKEKWSTVTIPYFAKVHSIEGRTIKPDGSIVELKKDAIFDRTVMSIKKAKLKTKSFAMPAVEPGAIIEYRWIADDWNSKFYLQKDIPFQTLAFHIKGRTTFSRISFFNCKPVPIEREAKEFVSFQMHNVEAAEEEPYMPPQDSVVPYMAFTSLSLKESPELYWGNFGRDEYRIIEEKYKPKGKILEITPGIIGSATDPKEKIAKLLEYFRSHIKNIQDDDSELTEKERENALKKGGIEETLNRGMGSASDIRMLFKTMAAAAGLDARVAFVADRSQIFFKPTLTHYGFLPERAVAIKIGENWKFYDPTAMYLPIEMLPWWKEGSVAFIPDEKNSLLISTPLSPPEKSIKKRSAKLRLGEDGTIEGDVSIEYTGHTGAQKKEEDDTKSATEREENLKNIFKESISTSELSNIQVENVTSKDKPYTYKFHIKVPGYAQRTGRRLFIQPAFFQKGLSPLFPNEQRKNSVYFSYPWSESDEVDIILPEGYDLESPEGIKPISAGNVGHHEIKLLTSNDHRLLRCTRKFFMGGESKILIPVKDYPFLKRFLDEVHQADSHTITLKQTASVN
jgi:hypothetical protein